MIGRAHAVRRAGDGRQLPGIGHRFAQRRPPPRRLLRRRLAEIALGRSRQRLPLYAARSDGESAGGVIHRMAGASASVRVRHRRIPRCSDDGMHMMNGTPAIPAYYAALAGLDIINSGRRRSTIRAKSRELTAQLLARVDEYGFASAAARDPDRLAGTVARRRAGRACWSRARSRPATSSSTIAPPVGVWISPHFYNTPAPKSIGSWRRSSRSSRRGGMRQEPVCRG